MRDSDKTKEQLMRKLEDMSQRIAEFGKSEAEHKKEVGKKMGNTESAKGADKRVESQSTDMIAVLAKEADHLVSESKRAARQEAKQEAERVLRQYEQRTKQIVLKIREEAKTKAAEIANRIRDTIVLKIEKASADVIAESSRKIEELIKKTQQIASEEAGQASTEAKVEAKGDFATPEETAGAEERKAELATEEGGKQPVEASQEGDKLETIGTGPKVSLKSTGGKDTESPGLIQILDLTNKSEPRGRDTGIS